MLILFYSETGKVRKFASNLSERGFVCKDILEHQTVEEDFILITPTYGFGQIPDEVKSFIDNNTKHLVAVASSGNKAWGKDLFGKSGDLISAMYDVPLIHKFQNSGFKADVDLFIERVLSIDKMD